MEFNRDELLAAIENQRNNALNDAAVLSAEVLTLRKLIASLQAENFRLAALLAKAHDGIPSTQDVGPQSAPTMMAKLPDQAEAPQDNPL